MAHHEVTLAGRREEAGEICRIIPARIEGDDAGEPQICREASRPQLFSKAARKRRDHHGLAGPDASPRDRAQTIGRITQIDVPREAKTIERAKERVANAGKSMDMLMPVEKIGLASHGGREGIDLAAELIGDLRQRQAPGKRAPQHAPEGRKLARRGEARHQGERMAAGEIEMHAEVGSAGEFSQARSSPCPILPVRHRARRRDAPLAQESEDRGAHPLAQGEIISAKDKTEHSIDTASIRVEARSYRQIVSIPHVD